MVFQHHVFLSYSRKDSDFMAWVRNYLRAEELTVWTDEGIEPGTPLWKVAIQEAIETAGCLVVIMSPASKASEWVLRELDYARAQGLPIFPLLARGDERNSIPLALIGSQFIDIRADAQKGIEKLVQTLCNHFKIESASHLRERLNREEQNRKAQAAAEAARTQREKERRERETAEAKRLKDEQALQERNKRAEDFMRYAEELAGRIPPDTAMIAELIGKATAITPNKQWVETRQVEVERKAQASTEEARRAAQQEADERGLAARADVLGVAYVLSPWNPLHQLKILYWRFLDQERFLANLFCEKWHFKAPNSQLNFDRTVATLSFNLLWLALGIPLTAYILQTIPVSADPAINLLGLGAFVLGYLGSMRARIGHGIGIAKLLMGLVPAIVGGISAETTYILLYTSQINIYLVILLALIGSLIFIIVGSIDCEDNLQNGMLSFMIIPFVFAGTLFGVVGGAFAGIIPGLLVSGAVITFREVDDDGTYDNLFFVIILILPTIGVAIITGDLGAAIMGTIVVVIIVVIIMGLGEILSHDYYKRNTRNAPFLNKIVFMLLGSCFLLYIWIFLLGGWYIIAGSQLQQ